MAKTAKEGHLLWQNYMEDHTRSKRNGLAVGKRTVQWDHTYLSNRQFVTRKVRGLLEHWSVMCYTSGINHTVWY